MLSSCHTKVLVLISIISVEVFFNHCWRSTYSTTAAEICVPLQLPGRQEIFHCSWSTASSIAGGNCFFLTYCVKYFEGI